ncbi:MAG: DsbA family oxidoreductase [Immundisolibacter sp.]|uniref:DsbA family oxidoreductase n=1 Tax=Immundisolibacter sp. TaxID=1934948 RepID=UPI003EDFB0C5
MANNDPKIQVEFFHDVMSCWCFHASQRLRALVATQPDIEVTHRSWPLATDPTLMTKIFPSKDAARAEICGQHWKDAHDVENDPRIDYRLMMTRTFDYPYSMPSQRGCKAAEKQGGQAAHWDFFDRAQKAHLTECIDTADPEVLARCAGDVGLDVARWRKDFEDTTARDAEIFRDMETAKGYGILRAPTLIANGKHQCHGEYWSTFGHRITTERLEVFFNDIRFGRKLGRA